MCMKINLLKKVILQQHHFRLLYIKKRIAIITSLKVPLNDETVAEMPKVPKIKGHSIKP